MTNAVIRYGEVAVNEDKMCLAPPTSFPELSHLAPAETAKEEQPQTVEEYSGPTVDDIRHEAEEFMKQWTLDKEAMISSAKQEAEEIRKEAEDAAFKEVKRKTDEAKCLKAKAAAEADKIIADALEKIKQMEAESSANLEGEKKQAEEQGRVAGQEAGFAEGKAEVERLINRSHIVLQRAQDKRTEILEETEQEIINLVLLIARKVVKVISESQRDVIVANVIQALRKVKGRGNIIIRVNLKDLKLSTEHIKDFTNLVEGAKSVQLQEDSAVDEGGCIIETDFGEIDARISSQLAELEAKILEISPIKSVAREGTEIAGG